LPRPARTKRAAGDPAAAARNTIAAKLARAGLTRDWDFVLHLPLRYEDETRIVPIGSVRHGDLVQVEGVVARSEAWPTPATVG
jgi:ATP-dependent DNA helicase RecG